MEGILRKTFVKRFTVLLIATTTLFSGCAYYGRITRVPDIALYNQTVNFNNTRYVPLLRFCDYYGLDWDWNLVSRKIEIKKGRDVVFLRPDSNLVLVNNKPVELDYPVEYKDGAAYIPVETALYMAEDIFGLAERPVPVAKIHRIETVVIDPGHGGKDPGAVSKYGTKEKDIVLDISRRLKRELERKGLKVFLTRDSDIFIPLHKRAAFANEKDADFFVSVHANASKFSSGVRGFEVYYLSETTDDSVRAIEAAENASVKFEEGKITKDGDLSTMTTVWDLMLKENRRQSKELAYYICNISSDSLSMNKRGVKGARFVVLKGARMPAVLVEVGFLTNRREEYQLTTSTFREKVASVIAHSILAYKREYERTDGFSE